MRLPPGDIHFGDMIAANLSSLFTPPSVFRMVQSFNQWSTPLSDIELLTDASESGQTFLYDTADAEYLDTMLTALRLASVSGKKASKLQACTEAFKICLP